MDNRAKSMRIHIQNGQLVGSGNVSRTGPGTPDEGSATKSPKRYKCPHCGVVFETDEPIEGTRVACPECGKEFVATSSAPESRSRPSASIQPQSPRASGGIKRKISIPLVLLVLAGAIGGGWWFVSGRNNGDKAVDGTSTGSVPASKQHPDGGKTKSGEFVRPILTLQTVEEHCKKYGGNVSPETCSFTKTENGIQATPAGNPIYSLRNICATWSHYETDFGDGHVFLRDDRYVCTDDPHCASLRKHFAEMCYAIPFVTGGLRKNEMDNILKNSGKMVTNILNRSSRFPAPIVFAYTNNAEQFLYLNESGRTSVLEWGISTNDWFWCYEGSDALSEYAKCLKTLKKTLIEYTEIAKEEELKDFRKGIPIKNAPNIYVGQLDQGTRKKVSVEYEFLVESYGTNVVYKIKETTDDGKWQYSKYWNSTKLETDLAFFSRFETKASTEKAFEPLYCFLSQQKILLEENSREMNRLNRRFGGDGGTEKTKKDQQLTFKSIGKQVVNEKIELSATAESGGIVQFTVESGPGKIEGRTLTFTKPGEVVVRARQWGNDKWYSATATQTVEVVSNTSTATSSSTGTTGRNSDSSGTSSSSVPVRESSAGRTSGGGMARQPAPSSPPPELAPLAKALEAFQREQIPPNLKEMETAWRALPGTQKSKLQKNVMWASCAMFLQHGNTGALEKRRAFVDTQALMSAVTEQCRSCRGKGHSEESCRKCHGGGSCTFSGCNGTGRIPRLMGGSSPCPNCHGSGRCPVCGGRGEEQVKCRSCNGKGRSFSQAKCQDIVETNIAEALRICRGEEGEPARERNHGNDAWGDDGWGSD